MLSTRWRRPHSGTAQGSSCWGGAGWEPPPSHLDGSSSTEKAPFMWMELRLFSNMP